MLNLIHLSKTVDTVRCASALTETTFVRLGQTLEESIAILSNLASSFQTVMTELQGENLGQSLEALKEAGIQVAQLGRDQSEVGATFDHLQRLGEAIAGRIAKLNRSVMEMDSLMINSKIAATAIRASEIDFTTFAGEIGRTMSLAQATLDSFGSELQTLRKRLGSAYAGQLAFAKRQDDAIRLIPQRLNATVASIPVRHRRAARAISAVRQRSERVREQVGTAIMALQVGDITRQRLEHADRTLSFLTEAGIVRGGTATEPMSRPADFTEDEQRALLKATCLLQAAQLSDAAAEFERDVKKIIVALNSLAAEARTLRNLASSAYGSTGRDQGTFIVELEAHVGEALTLFGGFGASRAEAAQVMVSVSDAAEILCAQLATVQSLEADIRIMGLNTTLKCARVGPEGRALGFIAQELRAYGNEFAREAGALMGEVESLTQITRSIGSREAGTAPLMAAVMQAMNDALSTLRQVGQTLDGTLSRLDRDSDRVVILLEETAANLGAHDEIDNVMHEAANGLREMSAPGDLRLTDLPPRVEQMLDQMARGYTMATERAIHDSVLGRAGGAAAAPAVVAKQELDDLLF
jgi:hypothetical protein